MSSKDKKHLYDDIKGPEDLGVSVPTFMTFALGIFSTGLVYGVYRVTRHQKTKISMGQHAAQVKTAAGALGWGTALCFGTFGIAGAVFSRITGVTDLQEFNDWMRKNMAANGIQYSGPKEMDEATKRESDESFRELDNAFNGMVDAVKKKMSRSD